MIYFAFISSWAVLIYLFLGFYVFYNAPKARLNRLFLLWALGMAEYSFCFTFLYLSATPQSYQLWYKLAVPGWTVHISLVLHMVLLLTHRTLQLPLKNGCLMALYAPGAVVLLFRLYLNDYLAPIVPNAFSVYFLFEELYIYSFSLACLILLWQWGRKTPLAQERKQARILIGAGFITFILSLIADVPPPGFHLEAVPPFGHLIILILAFALLYASIEYQFPGLVSLIKLKTVVNKVTDLVFLVDCHDRIVDYNQRVNEKLGYSSQELIGQPIDSVLKGDLLPEGARWNQTELCRCDGGTYCVQQSGALLPVNLQTALINDHKGSSAGAILLCQDRTALENLQAEIDARILKENQLHYLSSHDAVTGLFNRNYFEMKLAELDDQPEAATGIMICDIDGLKLANDSLGHNVGDQLLIASAQAIRGAFDQNEIVARIGGDEFAVLIPAGDKTRLKKAYLQIQQAIEDFNQFNTPLHLSLSIGYTVADPTRKIIDLFKEADNYMYKEKLNHVQSVRNAMIQALLSTLEARDLITEAHTQRIQKLLVEVGLYLNLTDSAITNLRLLGQFHDIGKVGIPDRILKKPGILTATEKNTMRQHSDIGYRIAKSVPDLHPIADLILRHHERWDGNGYPFGLQGEAIPLECRILAVVDAFDSMTNQRPYHQGMTLEAAVQELERNSGAQFDPEIVAVFLNFLAVKGRRDNLVGG